MEEEFSVLYFTEKAMDKPIYRIMPIHRSLEMVDDKQLVLVRPKLWDDPFENLLLDSKHIISGEVGSMPSIRDSVYGQCWTSKRETDAMWRIYSHDKNGVRIKTTPRKLISELRSSSVHPDISCFIGTVKYLSQKDLVHQLKSINVLGSSGKGIAESLLYKRKEFSHEKEVRVIYHSPNNTQSGNADIYKFPIRLNHLIDEMTFDPRMDKRMYTAYKAALVSHGFQNKINQSVLYAPPKALKLTY